MERKAKEKWCTIRCATVAQNNNEVINRTTLRFRPIAPKPASNDAVSGFLGADYKSLLLSCKRSKRKYVRVRKNKGYNRKNRISPHEEGKNGVNKTVVTLQFFPEKSDSKNSDSNSKIPDPLCNIIYTSDALDPTVASSDLNHRVKEKEFEFAVSDRTTVVESWVTVESRKERCMEGRGFLGSTDVERIHTLESDTCPGFISDGLNNVQWVNGAYKRMVMGYNDAEESEITVGLIMKENFQASVYSSFSTRARVQYTWQKEKHSKMVPCDAYRMDCGGFAWRLDIEAALSLGR